MASSTLERRSAHSDASEVVAEFDAWLAQHWDPDLSVGEWWERLGLAGWASPSLPEHAYGRGASRSDALRIQQRLHNAGALGPPSGLGLLLAAPTIASHGTQAQIDRYVRDIVTGQTMWCQLFSEPGAGSDLAGLQTRAVRDGAEWIVNGQKVWTTGAHVADYGMLIARTDPEVPKHRGITYFAIEMHQPGIEVRPLREMTGAALFNEVFLTDARVHDDEIIGELDGGWAVANTTLMLERAGLGAGGTGAVGGAVPGTVAGHLGQRAGDFVGNDRDSGDALVVSSRSLTAFAQSVGMDRDPTVRQGLADLYTLEEIARFSGLRAKAAAKLGREVPGLPNIAKLIMSELGRRARDLGLHITGPFGMLHGYTAETRAALDATTDIPRLGAITSAALFASAPSIYGGTDQIQRNLLGERVLGLPREARNDHLVAFRDLPKNA